MSQHSAPVPKRTWLPALIIGGLACGLLGVAMFTPAFLPAASPAQAVLPGLGGPAGTVIGQATVLITVPIVIIAWLSLRPVLVAGQGPSSWVVCAAWSLPLLVVPPVMSNDPYLYADQAWTIQQGGNPYDVGLSAIPGPYSDQVDEIWRGSTAVYPALTLITVWLSALITGFDPYWGVVAMRLPAIAGVMMFGVTLPALARAAGVDPRYAQWLGLANPLVIIHLIGGAHNDALMIGLIALALRCALTRPGIWLSPIALGLATATKQPAAFAGLAVAFVIGQCRRGLIPAIAEQPAARPAMIDYRKLIWPVVITGAVSVGVLLGISYLSGFGLGWVGALGLPGIVLSPAPVSLLTQLGMPAQFAVWLGRLALVALVLWILVRSGPSNPWRVLVVMMFAVAITGPVLHGWYLAWFTCHLALARYGLVAERIAVGLLTTLLVYLSMAEYLGWLVWAELAIGIVVALLLDRLAYRGLPGSLALRPVSRSGGQTDPPRGGG